MLQFSFIDQGLRDFVRYDNGEVLVKEFSSWEEADEYIMDGGLSDFDWTNQGTRKHCWNDPDD